MSELLLAFGFGNLAMLGWLAAAAAPLLIHLWSRHRFREAPWAAMQFLLAAMRKNARRLRLQQWLLLAVRTLLILLVVLAVAEPYGARLLAGGNSAPSHKVIVLDDSFSMGYRSANESIFARAKGLAERLVRESRPGDVFTIIRMSDPAKTIIGPAAIDHAAVTAQMESLTPSQSSADLAGTLSQIEQSLNDADGSNRPAQKEVYFFTDLQRSTWGAPATSAVNKNGKKANDISLEKIATQASIVAVDLGQPRAANLAVTNLATSDAFITLGREVQFDATLHQFANEPRSHCTVEFQVDDTVVAEKTIDVPAGGDSTVQFKHRFPSTGNHTVCVRATGDGLEVDNSRWLVVPVRDAVRVLCVAGREGAAKYLADALNPSAADDSAIRPNVISEGDFADVALADFDCVFLCNVAQLTTREAERLAKFAADGGGIVVFLGDRVVANNYNELKSAAPDSQLLPARVGDLVTRPQVGLDPLEYRHPIVAPFRGRERAGLLTTPVNRYYHLDVAHGRAGVEVAATLPDGNPFIVCSPLGRGRIALIATDGSLSSVNSQTGEPWTSWATWPSYLPLVRELLAYATAGQRIQWQQPIGTTIGSRGVLAPGMDLSKLQITRPDGKTATVTTQNSSGEIEWSYPATNVSGIYSLRGLPENQTQQFAVNVNTEESDLTKADAKELAPELNVRSTWKDDTRPRTADVLAHSNWNQPLLWAALALMFVESLLAWYFGRGAA